MNIETPWKSIAGTEADVYSFLSDLNNLEKMMPSQVVNWKSTAEECSFTIKGMSDMVLKIADRTPNSLVSMESGSSKPFPFKLNAEIKPEGNQAQVRLVFDGKVNAFMSMMIEKPLSNFFNLLLDGLNSHFSNS